MRLPALNVLKPSGKKVKNKMSFIKSIRAGGGPSFSKSVGSQAKKSKFFKVFSDSFTK